MNNMEGLQYDTSLDLNIVYYTIQLYTQRKDTTTIVATF